MGKTAEKGTNQGSLEKEEKEEEEEMENPITLKKRGGGGRGGRFPPTTAEKGRGKKNWEQHHSFLLLSFGVGVGGGGVN